MVKIRIIYHITTMTILNKFLIIKEWSRGVHQELYIKYEIHDEMKDIYALSKT